MEVVVNQNEVHKALWTWLVANALDNGINELSFISARYNSAGEIINDNRFVYTPITVGKSTEIYQDIQGKKSMQYDFMLKQYAPLTTQSNVQANIVVLSVFEKLILWMQEAINAGNTPIFPDNIIVNEFVINDGTIAGTDALGAEFQIIINILYDEV